MADCSEFQAAVDRLKKQIADTEDLCASLTDINEQKQCRAELAREKDKLRRAQAALTNCLSGLPAAGIQETQGHITFLRVHDAGGFGPPTDFLDAETIFILDTQPNRAFGFQLRADNAEPAHEGMLALLRDALVNDFNLVVDYNQVANKRNAIAFRIAVTR